MPIYPQDAQGVLSSGTGTNYLFDSPRVGDTAQFSLIVSGESPPKYDPNFTLPGVPGIAWSLNGTSWGAENTALSGLVVTAEGTTVYAKCISAQASPVTVAIDSAGLIELPPANQAPAFTTAATVSAIGATGCTVTAVAADPDGDTMTYKVAVTTSITPPTDWSAYSNRAHAAMIAGVAIGSLTASTNYYAHVQVTDSLNDPVVSTSAQFATAAANQQPTFITPTTVSSITDEGCVVTAAASDPDGDTLIYKLAITTSATPPTDWSVYSDRTHALMVSGVTVGSLTASTNYYAHVQVRDGVTTPVVSTSAQFTTAAPNQQPSFTTEATVSNITSVGCVVTAAATDPDGDALTYQVAISTTITPPTDWSAYTTTDRTHAQMVAGVAMSGLTAETNYYAHVRVTDGVTAWVVSTSAMFSTLASSSISLSVVTTSSISQGAVTVTATGTDSESGVLTYRVAATASSTPPVDWSSYSDKTHNEMTAGVRVFGLSPSNVYYAHVRVMNESSATATGSSSSFNTPSILAATTDIVTTLGDFFFLNEIGGSANKVSGTTYLVGDSTNIAQRIIDSVIRFDISQLAGKTSVTSAKIRLYEYFIGASPDPKSYTVDCHKFLVDWHPVSVSTTERFPGVPWTSIIGSGSGSDYASAYTDRKAYTVSTTAANAYVEFDVTADINAMLTSGWATNNFGWRLRCPEAWSITDINWQGNTGYYSSRNETNKPALRIVP